MCSQQHHPSTSAGFLPRLRQHPCPTALPTPSAAGGGGGEGVRRGCRFSSSRGLARPYFARPFPKARRKPRFRFQGQGPRSASPGTHRRKSAVPAPRSSLGSSRPRTRISPRPPAGSWGSPGSRPTGVSWLSSLWASRPPASRRSWGLDWGREQKAANELREDGTVHCILSSQQPLPSRVCPGECPPTSHTHADTTVRTLPIATSLMLPWTLCSY